MRKLKVLITINNNYDVAEYCTNKDCTKFYKSYYDEDFFSRNFFPAEVHFIDEECEIFKGDLIYYINSKYFEKSEGYYSKDNFSRKGRIGKVVASTEYFDASINGEYQNILKISDSTLDMIAKFNPIFIYGITNEDDELLDNGYCDIEIKFPKEVVGFTFNEVEYLLDKALRDFRSDVLPFGKYPDYHIIEFINKFKENLDEYNYPKN